MKLAMYKSIVVMTVAFGLLIVTACGQKGPLVLPDQDTEKKRNQEN